MLAFVLIAIGTIQAATVQDFGALQHDPHFKSNRTVIVQLFEWKFNDIAKECETFLGPRGFAGIQVSPVSENVIRNDFSRPWWERYHPISYKIASRSGNEDEFEAMTKACNDAGVRVYVNVVLNHMAAPRPGGNAIQNDDGVVNEAMAYEQLMEGTGGSQANAALRSYPSVPYDDTSFHRRCAIVDYTDAHQIRNCELKQLPDLDHSNSGVQKAIVDFLNKLVDLGAAGFRVDAAKYMWPADLRDIYEMVNNLSTKHDFPENSRPFFLQEVIDLSDEAISKTEYIGYGVVTESRHAVQIADVFNGQQPMSSMENWGPARGFLQSLDALVFIDTHYTQRGNGLGGMDPKSVLTYEKPKKYTMAVAFMLAHPYGIKRIMSSFRFDIYDGGPPADGNGDITSPEFMDHDGQCKKESGWVCEHRWNAIANMVAFASYVADEDINGFQIDGERPNHVAFCRGNRGFITFNNDLREDFEKRMYGCVPPGNYCDIISGSLVNGQCTGVKVTVDKDRSVMVTLPAKGTYGVLAIFDGSRIN